MTRHNPDQPEADQQQADQQQADQQQADQQQQAAPVSEGPARTEEPDKQQQDLDDWQTEQGKQKRAVYDTVEERFVTGTFTGEPPEGMEVSETGRYQVRDV